MLTLLFVYFVGQTSANLDECNSTWSGGEHLLGAKQMRRILERLDDERPLTKGLTTRVMARKIQEE